jgi:hypothetical protein
LFQCSHPATPSADSKWRYESLDPVSPDRTSAGDPQSFCVDIPGWSSHTNLEVIH